MLTGNVAEEEEEEGAAAAEGRAVQPRGRRACVACGRRRGRRPHVRPRRKTSCDAARSLRSRRSGWIRRRRTSSLACSGAAPRPRCVHSSAARRPRSRSRWPCSVPRPLPRTPRRRLRRIRRRRRCPRIERGLEHLHAAAVPRDRLYGGARQLARPARAGQPQRRGGRRGPEIGSREWLEREKRRTAVRIARRREPAHASERRRAGRRARGESAARRESISRGAQRRATKEAEAAERRSSATPRAQRSSEAVRAHAQRVAAKASAERARRELCFLDKLASHEGGAVLVESDGARLKLKIAPPIRQPVAPGRRAVRFVLAGHWGAGRRR